MSPTATKLVKRYGPSRGGVRVIETPDRVLVSWIARNQRKYKTFPKTREGRASAKVWAETFWLERQKPEAPARITVRQLWERYVASEEYDRLRPRTRLLYAGRWRWWEDYLGKDTPAETVTLEQIGTFRTEQSKMRAVNQVRAIFTVARLVWRWGERHELVVKNVWSRYRWAFSKEEKVARPSSYSDAQVTKLLGVYSPHQALEWRAYSALTLLATQGVRARAGLGLQWDDVDFEAGWLTWRSETDKMGRTWGQPMLAATREALYVALGWRDWAIQRGQTPGPWVFFTARPGRGQVPNYTIQALEGALRRAEEAVGITHERLRGLHGLRRYVVNRVRKVTDDPMVALRWIGDTDARQAESYVRVDRRELVALGQRLEDS